MSEVVCQCPAWALATQWAYLPSCPRSFHARLVHRKDASRSQQIADTVAIETGVMYVVKSHIPENVLALSTSHIRRQ